MIILMVQVGVGSYQGTKSISEYGNEHKWCFWDTDLLGHIHELAISVTCMYGRCWGLVTYLLDTLSGGVTGWKPALFILGLQISLCNPHTLILQSMYNIYLTQIFFLSFYGLKL